MHASFHVAFLRANHFPLGFVVFLICNVMFFLFVFYSLLHLPWILCICISLILFDCLFFGLSLWRHFLIVMCLGFIFVVPRLVFSCGFRTISLHVYPFRFSLGYFSCVYLPFPSCHSAPSTPSIFAYKLTGFFVYLCARCIEHQPVMTNPAIQNHTCIFGIM